MAKTSWLAQPRNFSKIYDLDEHPADIKQKNIATLYNKICDLSMPKNKSSASIGSLQLIQSCSLLMRLQDRNPELRSPLRDVIRNDFSTKPTYFGMAFFADSVFLSIIQQQVPGIFWQRPEAIQQVECLPKLAKLITSNSYKFNLAISLLTPPNITNAENGYVPEDYRKLICENSIFNANFADDLIDLFFNYEFWGDKFDRRYLFNFILPEYVEEALDLQARTLPQAELKAKEASREIARKFVEGSASNQVF